MFRLQLASNCIQPTPFLRYKQEAESIDYSRKLQAELNSEYTFPIQLSSLPGNPVIYSLDSQFAEGEMVSIVHYVNSLPLNNTVALNEEANLMNPVIQEMLSSS